MKFLTATLASVLFFTGSLTQLWAQNKNHNVLFVPQSAPLPDAKLITTIKAGNNSTKTHCRYDNLVTEAKEKARAKGGNIVKLKSLLSPFFLSSCYGMEAEVYLVKDLNEYKRTHGIIITEDTVAKNTDYATVYIYRLADTTTFSPGYDLHLENDSVIGNVRGKSNYIVRLYQEGEITFWAKQEQETDISVNAKFGSVYYLRCGVRKGEFRMIPVLELVDNKTGAKEYSAIALKEKNNNVKYLSVYH